VRVVPKLTAELVYTVSKLNAVCIHNRPVSFTLDLGTVDEGVVGGAGIAEVESGSL